MVKHTRKRRGGAASPKLAGQGTYGCGFMPALSCSYNTVDRTDTFSKIMVNDTNSSQYSSVLEEIIKTYKLHTIDPTYKYSLYPSLDTAEPNNTNTLKITSSTYKKCRLRPNNVVKHGAELSKCKLIEQPINLNKYIILQSPFGGISLTEYIAKVKTEFNPGKFIDLLLSINNLFEGLLEFHKNTLYHMDIKLPNIVVKETSTGLQTRFIDFGISIDLQNSSDRIDSSMYDQPYFAWPFELYFYNKNNAYIPKYKIATVLNNFYKDAMQYNIDSYIIPYNNYIDIRTGRYIYNADNIYPNIESLKNKSQSYYFQKTDIYSMGIIINAIIFNIIGVVLNYRLENNNIVSVPLIKIPRTTTFTELYLKSADNIPNIMLIRKFIEYVGFDILQFANKLVSFHPEDRYSTVEAYTKYNELCGRLNTNRTNIINLIPLPKNTQSFLSKIADSFNGLLTVSPSPPPMPPTSWIQPRQPNHVAINMKAKKLNHITIPIEAHHQPARLPARLYTNLKPGIHK